MLFALLDYANYRLRRGRYGEGVGASGMAVAYRDSLPQSVLDELQHGDTIFTQRLNSTLSWGTMYFASAPVDHVAVYIGSGKVFHATINGSKVHDIQAIAKGARILPARIDFPESDLKPHPDASLGDQDEDDHAPNGGFINRKRRLSHALPAKLQLVWVALLLMVGFYIDRYRWKFSADFLIGAAIVDAPVYLLTGWVVAAPFAVLALLATAWNVITLSWKRHRNLPHEILSHPDIMWRHLHGFGGTIFSKLGPLSICAFGIMPRHVYLSLQESIRLRSQSTDDRPDDDFEEAGKL